MSLAGPWRSHQEQSRLIASGVLADKPLCDELRLLKSGGILHGIALAIGQFRLKALEVALFVVLRNPRALHDAPRPLPHPAVARHGYLACRAVCPRHELPSRPSAQRAIFERHYGDPQKTVISEPASAWRAPQSNASSADASRSEEHTSELQSRLHLVCRLLLEKKNDPPGGGDNRARSRKPKIEDGRPALGSPRQRGPREGLFEIHHRWSEAVVIDSNEGGQSPRKITNRERMDFLPLRDREHAKGRRGHDAERPLRSDEQSLQVETGRGSHRGTGAYDGPVSEDDLEPEDLIPHRPAEVSRVPDPVCPDRPSEGRARARPRIVAEGETLLSQSAIQRLQDDAGLRGCSVRGSVDRQDSSHPTHVEDDRIGRGSSAAHQAGTATPRHDREARIRGEADDYGDIFRRARPDDRGGIDAILREAGPTMGSERIQPVPGRDPGTRSALASAATPRELRGFRAPADV